MESNDTRGCGRGSGGQNSSSDDAGGCDCDLWLSTSTLNMQRKAIEADYAWAQAISLATSGRRPAGNRRRDPRSSPLLLTSTQTQQSTMLHTRGRCLQDDIRFAYDYWVGESTPSHAVRDIQTIFMVAVIYRFTDRQHAV